ncbi:MAG TPA: MFS transporter [Abditibacteriaceae bacterium]|jgi:nucleoside transporter
METATNSSVRNKLFLMMVLEIFIWGAWLPKLYSYMTLLKFEEGQKSLVFSIFGIASILGIFFSNQFADRNFAAEKFLAFSHVVGGLALLAVSTQQDFWPFFICFLLYGIFYVPTISVANSLAFAHLKNPAKEFGFVRMGGTIGWIVASWPFIFLLVGDKAADPSYVKWIFVVAAIGSFVMAAFSMTLPHTPPRKDVEGVDKLAWVRSMKLLAVPSTLLLFIVTFIDAVIHNGYFVLSDSYLTDRVKIAGNLSMLVMSLGQMAEIFTMLILGTVLAKLGWKWTMIIGILGHAARFLIFAFFPDVQPLIIAVQLLHGICYAFFFATVYIFVDAVFPADVKTSAQGLFNMLILGVGQVAASFLFTALKDHYSIKDPVTQKVTEIDWQTLFLVPAGMAFVAVVLMALFFKPPTERPEEVGAAAAPH